MFEYKRLLSSAWAKGGSWETFAWEEGGSWEMFAWEFLNEVGSAGVSVETVEGEASGCTYGSLSRSATMGMSSSQSETCEEPMAKQR